MTELLCGGMILGTVLWSGYGAWCAHASGDIRLFDAHVTAVIMGAFAGLMLVVAVRLKRLVELQDGLIKRLLSVALRMRVVRSGRD